MSDNEQKKNSMFKVHSHPNRRKWFIIGAGVILIVAVAVVVLLITGSVKKADVPTTTVGATDEYNGAAIKKQLESNPLPATASVEDKTSYYDSLIHADYSLGDKDVLRIYEEALAKGVPVSSSSAKSAARMYAKLGNNTAALQALNQARDIINNQPYGDDPDGGMDEQLSDVDALQKELGL